MRPNPAHCAFCCTLTPTLTASSLTTYKVGLVLLPKGMACPHCATLGDGQPLRLLDSQALTFTYLPCTSPLPRRLLAPSSPTQTAAKKRPRPYKLTRCHPHLTHTQPPPPTLCGQEEARSYQDSPGTAAGLARAGPGVRSDVGSDTLTGSSGEHRAHSPLKVGCGGRSWFRESRDLLV